MISRDTIDGEFCLKGHSYGNALHHKYLKELFYDWILMGFHVFMVLIKTIHFIFLFQYWSVFTPEIDKVVKSVMPSFCSTLSVLNFVLK